MRYLIALLLLATTATAEDYVCRSTFDPDAMQFSRPIPLWCGEKKHKKELEIYLRAAVEYDAKIFKWDKKQIEQKVKKLKREYFCGVEK
jgi:hypothetical protein